MNTVHVFTDGACSNNGTTYSQGGLGVFFPEWREHNLSEKLPITPRATNNRAELSAVVRALQQCDLIDPNKEARLVVHSDSALVCGTVGTWMHTWKRLGWLKLNRRPPSNLDLLQTLDGLLQHRTVIMKHVRAHTGRLDPDSMHNAAADELATSAVRPLTRSDTT